MNEDRAHFIPQCFEGIVRPRVNVFPHAHTFHEIVYCASGKGIQHAGQLSFPMSEGDLLFLPAGMDHLAETVTESVILHVVYFSDTSLGDIPGPCDIPKAVIDYLSRRSSEGNCVVPLDAASRRRAKSIIARLMDETYGRSAGHVLALLLGLGQLLLVLLRDANIAPELKGIGTDHSTERIRRVISYVHAHYMQPLSVKEMASLACLSRSQFHAAFKTVSGKTFVDYVQDVRISRAMEMLSRSDLTISSVALRCGFDTLSHFYHVFSAKARTSPAKFARGYRTGNSPIARRT